MKNGERLLCACLDPKDIAGGHQAESRCPEVEYEFAHQFLLEPAVEAPDKTRISTLGPDGGRDR